MADLTIYYKDEVAAELSESGTKVLTTEGKYCEDDITVVYESPLPKSSITVTGVAQSGSVSCVTPKGVTKQFAWNGTAWYLGNLSDLGTYTITATEGTKTKTQDLLIDVVGEYEVAISLVTIMGVSRDVTNSSPAWTRTDDSVGFTFTRGVGNSGYHSDFDSMPIYKDILRETINGDVLVKIPKFWYQRKVTNNIETIRIADGEVEGFELHPLFDDGGRILDCVYVGAYETSSGYGSKTGKSPLVNITRSASRTGHKNRGSGYSQFDAVTWSAIQMLMLVEIANNNVQAVIGDGIVGASAAISTGGCDTMYANGQLSGCAANNSSSAVIWRGIENLWGNVWKLVDGVNVNGQTYYVCTDRTKYADDTSTGYKQLSYTSGSTSYSDDYITREGFDANSAFAMFPSQASGGSGTTYYCDGIWISTGWRVCVCGGRWVSGSRCGLFCVNVGLSSSASDSNIGARLVYRP